MHPGTLCKNSNPALEDTTMFSTCLISGVSFSAVLKKGKWHPAKIDLGTGATKTLRLGFDDRDDAIIYAMNNLN